MKIRETRQEELKSLDRETFERIYKTYYRPLCLHAQKIVGCEEDAEDIVQDFFTNLWEKRKNIDIDTSLKAYLYQGIHNKCLNHLEHIKVARQYSELTLDMDDNSDWNIIHTKQIVFEATDSCNLNCTYCALGDLYEGYDERTSKKINTRYAINFLKYIFERKPKSKNNQMYISFYGGEATLNMNFIKQIVEVANQLNIEKEIKLAFSILQ